MARTEITFTNELGNEIYISVEVKGEEVTTVIAGPTSLCENILTRKEAAMLLNQMSFLKESFI